MVEVFTDYPYTQSDFFGYPSDGSLAPKTIDRGNVVNMASPGDKDLKGEQKEVAKQIVNNVGSKTTASKGPVLVLISVVLGLYLLSKV